MQTLPHSIDPATLSAIQGFLARLHGKYDVARAVLFGSRARGDCHAESDADLLLILRGEARPTLATKLAMVDEAYDIEIDTGLVISPLPVWECQWSQPESTQFPALLKTIAREGIEI